MQIPDHISASYIKNCYKNTSLSKSKSSKKLASGYRINTAADDAAKLSISEKMRAQIRGLDQGVSNAQDAYSLCQTIDGKAQSCHALLQRIRELSLQAVNGTYTDQDRAMLQQEVNQSIKELVQIPNGLLDGASIGMTKRCVLDDEDIWENLRNWDNPEIKQFFLYDGDRKIPKEACDILLAGISAIQFGKDLIAKIEASPDKLPITLNKAKEKTILAVTQLIDALKKTSPIYGNDLVKDEQGEPTTKIDWNAVETGLKDWINDPVGKHNEFQGVIRDYIWDRSMTRGGTMLRNVSTLLRHMVHIPYVVANYPREPIEKLKGYADKYIELKTTIKNQFDNKITDANLKGSQLLQDFEDGKYATVYRGIQDMIYGRNYDGSLRDQKPYEMYVQVGANAGHAIKLTFSHLEFYDLRQENVLSEEAAKQMLQAVDLYLGEVSDFISAVGSYQNRLQHAMEYAMEHAEIETDAESRIRDADYGKESVTNVKQNLQQQVQETLFTEEKRRREQMNQVLYRE